LAEKQQTRIGRINREKKDSFYFIFLLGGGNAQHIFRRFLFDISIEPDETSV
jgi:hypothetical protein